MVYLIKDKNEELLDVLNFTNDDELKAYIKANPSHIVELTDPSFDDSLLIDEEELFDDYLINL